MTDVHKSSGLNDDDRDDGFAGGRKKLSPFRLSPHENPGDEITRCKFTGENYSAWSKAVRISLKARNRFGLLDGSLSEPALNSDDYVEWSMLNSMLLSWLTNTIEQKLWPTFDYIENAKELWTELQNRYAVPSGIRVQQLKDELVECKQRGRSVVEYYSALKGL